MPMKLAPTTTARCGAAGRLDQGLGVLARAQREDARQVRARHVEAARPRAARDEDRVGVIAVPSLRMIVPRGDVELEHVGRP